MNCYTESLNTKPISYPQVSSNTQILRETIVRKECLKMSSLDVNKITSSVENLTAMARDKELTPAKYAL